MKELLAACLALLALPAAARAAPMNVDVVRDGERWTAELRFERRASAWAFIHSPVSEEGRRPVRPQSWAVETPGVRLERHGFYDVLVADRGAVPERVRIRFAPFPDRVANAYDPALVFSDGTVALYTEQFDAFPVADPARIDRLPADLTAANIPYSATRVTFRDTAGPLLYEGRRQSLVTVETEGDGSYVLFGRRNPVETRDLTMMVDPALPAWIRTSIEGAMPRILAGYASALGPAPGPKPTIIVSWRGPTPSFRSLGGGTLAGLVVMRFEGEGMVAEDPVARHSNLWFLAHESAHFWLGQAVHFGNAQEAWITEGGADLLAFAAVAAADPTYDPRVPLQSAIEDCVSLSRGRGIASAIERGENRAYYACGAVFALIAEAASQGPFTRFVRGLIDANRADREVTRRDWLAALDRASGDPTLSRDIGRMLDRGAADPKAAIASLFTRARVRFELGPDRAPRLL